MKTDIVHNPDFGVLQVTFDHPGEKLVAEAGAMVARDHAVIMQTNLRGGVKAALKRRVLGGESLFQNTFVASAAGQRLWIAPAPEGAIIAHELQMGQSLFLQAGAYLASGTGVHLDTKFQGAKRGLFSGEGLFLLRAHGVGPLWMSSYGAIHVVDIGAELEGYKCDTSHMVAFSEGLDYQVHSVGGIKSFLFSGEGFICTFAGRGRLWMQTRDPRALAGFLQAFRTVLHTG